MSYLSEPPEISLKNDSADEKRLKLELLGLFKIHDLAKWFYTENLTIEDSTIPHSHPILTLTPKTQSTIYLGNSNTLLATYLHEQLHWFLCLEEKNNLCKQAIVELGTLFHDLPVGFPNGCKNHFSNYLHIIINFLEYQALIELIGTKLAKEQIQNRPFYKYIYKLVLVESAKIAEVIAAYSLNPIGIATSEKHFIFPTSN